MHRSVLSRAGLLTTAFVAGGLAVAAPASAGTPASGVTHHFAPLSFDCAGVPLTIVAAHGDHAAGHVVVGGTGVALLVSYSFGGDETVVVRPRNAQPTVTCTADVEGSPVTFQLLRHAAR